jgi:amidase
MTVKRPTADQLRAVAADLGMSMSDADLASYLGIMQANFAAYDIVAAMPDYLPTVKYPRAPGYKPEGEENKYNAWYVKTKINGASAGKLAGKTVVLKDNVCLAGVPMMNGASTLEGYTPDIDATIVTRILDAGGIIVGKAHCEYFCFSNRPFEVKRFQTIRRCGVDVTHGLVLLFGIGTQEGGPPST